MTGLNLESNSCLSSLASIWQQDKVLTEKEKIAAAHISRYSGQSKVVQSQGVEHRKAVSFLFADTYVRQKQCGKERTTSSVFSDLANVTLFFSRPPATSHWEMQINKRQKLGKSKSHDEILSWEVVAVSPIYSEICEIYEILIILCENLKWPKSMQRLKWVGPTLWKK